jgi:hypothetical protein
MGALRHARAAGEAVQGERLSRTELGSYVICEDKQLLYEEAPQAYKNITTVIDDLVREDLAEVVAVLKPLVTLQGEAVLERIVTERAIVRRLALVVARHAILHRIDFSCTRASRSATGPWHTAHSTLAFR